MRNLLSAIATRVCTKGSVMSEAAVRVSAIRLLNSLHEQARVQVGRGNDTEKIRLGTRRGGRQGCKFGPDIFNAAFAAALQDVVNDIQKLGLFVSCSHLKKLDVWFAGDVESPHLGSPRPNEQRAGKVVYVDDLGLMLAAATPRVLMRKLPTALDCLGEHCERHGLRVNYQPGKTDRDHVAPFWQRSREIESQNCC